MKTSNFLIRIMVLLFLLLTVSSCNFKSSRNVMNCFYYWKSVFEANHTDLAELTALKTNRLYLKFFDVVWDPAYREPVPVSIIEFKSVLPTRIEIVPVVFITVDALERLPLEQSNGLAVKLYRKIQSILVQNQLRPIPEIQLDCDWNASTKLKYFTILTCIRKLIAPQKIKLTATIRLHQVKYASQTGIPPVDKGMLMFYNFDSPKSPDVNNSILDLKVGMQYTSGLRNYPLDLDLALPLFSWGVLFQDNRFQGLIPNLHLADLSNNQHFKMVSINNNAHNRFIALTDCSLKNIRVYKNDLIRVEESRFEESLASARYLARRIRNSHLKVALFYFDRNLIQGVGGREKVRRLYRSFL